MNSSREYNTLMVSNADMHLVLSAFICGPVFFLVPLYFFGGLGGRL
jgi:hypothetical protein